MDISATPQIAVSHTAADIDVSRAAMKFELFYRESAESVARALALTLGDVELAADATNEAMTRAYQRWSRLSTYEKPAAWVYRVGLNWALGWKRRRRRERDQPVVATPNDLATDVRDDSLDGVVRALSLDHRAVVVCRIYLDLSVAQSATALGIAPGTVTSRLSRALVQLRIAFDQVAPEAGDAGATRREEVDQ